MATKPTDGEPLRPADQTDVRRNNLSLVLRKLREGGGRSRAKLAEETGLTKASVSSLVAELVVLGLVREGEVEQTGYTGRPGQAYHVDGNVYGIGVEINVDYISAVLLDLTGRVRASKRVALDVRGDPPERALDAVAELVRQCTRLAAVRGARPIGLTVATPGMVDDSAGRVEYASNLGWRDVEVAAGLDERLKRRRYPIAVDNDVKLAAMAEWAAGAAAGTPDLAYLSGEAGVGAGIIMGGRVIRGARGFSGEIGHLPLDPENRPCVCGRRGCWEGMVGLGRMLELAADQGDPVHDPELDIEDRLAEIRRRAESGDVRVLGALEEIAAGLGLGASVLLNMVNPAVLVLGGYFAVLGDFLLDGVHRQLRERVVSPDAGGCQLELSTLGFAAAGHGGAHMALERVLNDPALAAG